MITPPQPREILVEHRPEPTALPPETSGPPRDLIRTATEEAAESVRQQMVRILGQDETEPPAQVDPAPTADGATPEEITAAISELVGDSDPETVQRSVWPQREELPHPPQLDETGPRTVHPSGLAPDPDPDPVDVIDDLEEVHVSQESIERAVEMNQVMEAEQNQGAFLAALPFGVLAMIGAALSGYGIASQFGLVQSDHGPRSSPDHL